MVNAGEHNTTTVRGILRSEEEAPAGADGARPAASRSSRQG